MGGWLLASIVMACQAAPAEGEPKAEETVAPHEAVAELPNAAVIDLGEEGADVEGFSPPEEVGTRRASWSEAETSKVAFKLRPDADEYLVAWLGEPFHALGNISVSVGLNEQPVAEARLERTWRAYKVVAPRARLIDGRNELTFRYSNVARPSDVDPQSNDLRPLAMQFEQVQVQPIRGNVQLAFDNKSALALAHLEEGWAFDPADRAKGIWTLGNRSTLSFHLKPEPGVYALTLTAFSLPGVAERSVNVTLNGTPLGSLTFGEARTSVQLDVPSEKLRAKNDLVLEFDKLKAPSEIDPRSKDQRLLGLRLFALRAAPK